MTTYRYTTLSGANEAKAVGIGIPVSFKQSYEVSKMIRGKSLTQAKKMLEEVIAHKRPVPMTRFNQDTGHKPGMAAGRYAINTCTYILKLLKSAESNAQFKGLSTANLVVHHIAAQQGPNSWHYGRQKRRRAKRAHVEIIVRETSEIATRTRNKRAISERAQEHAAGFSPAVPDTKETAKKPRENKNTSTERKQS